MCEKDYYISYIYKYKIRHVELTQKLLLSTIRLSNYNIKYSYSRHQLFLIFLLMSKLTYNCHTTIMNAK